MKLAEYIGMPFERMDCYALVRDIYKTQHNIELADPKIRFDENYKIFMNFALEVSKNWVTCKAQRGAVIALRYDINHPNIVTHFGYCIDDKRFIHTLKETGAIVEEIAKYKTMTEGFYSYEPNHNAQ
jgi:cell wall-associated NlpC family hydrolase